MNCAILLAAGSGTRMGDSVEDKILFPIKGEPVICYSIKAFTETNKFDHYIIVYRDDIQKENISNIQPEKVENDNHIVIKSPIIGTFYRKPSPDKPSFVEIGKSIAEGDVLCVIEAMKLFNEIESEVSGKIVKILVEDQSPVQFDQPLFIIDPS